MRLLILGLMLFALACSLQSNLRLKSARRRRSSSVRSITSVFFCSILMIVKALAASALVELFTSVDSSPPALTPSCPVQRTRRDFWHYVRIPKCVQLKTSQFQTNVVVVKYIARIIFFANIIFLFYFFIYFVANHWLTFYTEFVCSEATHTFIGKCLSWNDKWSCCIL